MTDHVCTTPRLNKLLGAYELGLLSDEERTTIENHILECDACFEDLYQTSLIEKASRVSEKREIRRRRWFIPAISAAMLVFGFSSLLYFMAQGPEIKRSINPIKYEITLINPLGTVETESGLVRFTWKSSGKSLLYHITVFDEEGSELWSDTTTERSETVDLSKTGPLEGGKTYFWKVEGVDDRGRVHMTSRVSSFLIGSE